MVQEEELPASLPASLPAPKLTPGSAPTGEHQKLFQDSICVNIPMSVTADLGKAIRRTREKRVKALYESFPSLKKELPNKEDKDKEELDSEDDEDTKDKDKEKSKDGTGNNDPPKKKSKSNSNAHVPQRNQYGNVLDYLEAKYVRGVMLQDEEDAVEIGDDEEEVDEKGSVYDSESSFLDDALLKRDVAEQVLSQATHTKLELEQDDDNFFVNVGMLEVEDHDLMDYDPLEEEKTTKKPTKRKRATSLDSKSSKKSKSATKPVPATDKTKGKKDQPAMAGAKKAPTKTTAQRAKAKMTPEMKEQVAVLKKRAMLLKSKSDKIYDDTRKAIKKMNEKELPRKKKNEKVSIVVPDGKSPGDDITFANPHVPGQKLRVKVPKNTAPGSKFVVSVPVPVKANPDVDNNKWPRLAQDLLDEFSHAYDDWCHAEAAWRDMDPSSGVKFQLHHERMNKFDKLLPLFPKDLITPVDPGYLRKVVRRARQNKHKRSKTAHHIPDDGQPSSVTEKDKDEEESIPEKKDYELALPGKGTEFSRVAAPESF
jgi:hypothetical protein